MTGDPVNRDSPSRPPQFRTCTGCGEQLDVSQLLPRRGYRCHRCGTVMMHLVGLTDPEGANSFRKPLWSLRLALAILLPAGLVWLALVTGEMYADAAVLYAVMLGAAVVSAAGCIWARRLSRDGVGLVGVMLTAAGLGTAALLAVAELPDPARANAPALMALAWLGIGGSQLARFVRRLRLPAIGPAGVVRD